MIYWPPVLSGLLIVWTLYISPHTKYGDTWALVPVPFVFVSIVLIHLRLLIKGQWRSGLWAYALLNIAFLFMVSLWSLTLISKDSL
jgi:hypothetical protein